MKLSHGHRGMGPAGRCRAIALAVVVLLVLVTVTVEGGSPAAWAAGPYSTANGSGSSYAGLAFQQWVTDGQTQGLPVNYTPTSSPQGLEQYQSGIIPYAGTEAEFSSLLGVPDASIPAGFEYTPDVAGATAVMYNVQDQAGRKVTYLHLDQRTIARIFMGYITNWDDPEITADNLNRALPSHPITIIYRAGQSGTTALFYDFVAHADPAVVRPWANAHDLPTTTRIIQLDNGSNFAPLTEAVSGSDQQAEDVASQPWSISYDEFSYPKTYGAQVAWVKNAAGKWTQPYAINITAALASATLNPDLSQNLAGVYTSPNPVAYPISAYSYIVTKCAGSSQFPTCKGTYPDQGLANTLGTWMSYIACAGQIHMAEIGYAPLPPSLSQDMANSVNRITGQPAVSLTASNCANPRFNGLLGVGASGPSDPYLSVTSTPGAPAGATNPATPGNSGSTPTTAGANTLTGGTQGENSGSGAAPSPTPGETQPGGAGATGVGRPAVTGHTATGLTGGATGASRSGAGHTATETGPTSSPVAVGSIGTGVVAVGGGTAFRLAKPVAYNRPIGGNLPIIPLAAFLVILIVPAMRFGPIRRHRGSNNGRRATTDSQTL